MAMNKSQVQTVSRKARMLMKLDNQVWKKYGWKSGGDVDPEKFKAEIKKKVGHKSLTYLYYLILEDANYHSMNQTLQEVGAFRGSYGDDQSEKEYKEYLAGGGKTWQL